MIFEIFQIFVLLTPAFGGYVFPDDFKVCKITDEHLSECMLEATREAWPKFADPGLSSPIEIKTEPLYAPFVEYHHNSDVFILDEYGYDLVHTGFINSTILNLNADLATITHNYTVFTPKMVQTSTYKINGTLLYNGTRAPEPIWGTGKVVKTLYNLTVLHQLRANIEEREDGQQYLQDDGYDVTTSVDFITIKYDNLFNGTDPKKAERVAKYVNKNAPYIMANMQTYVEEFLAALFQNYTNRIVGSIPFNKLYPTE